MLHCRFLLIPTQLVSIAAKLLGEDLFLTEVLTREAIEALKVPVSRRQPFYLYMAHYAVHAPYDEDTRFTARYRGRYDRQPPVASRTGTPALRGRRGGH